MTQTLLFSDKNGKHIIKPIIIKLAPSSFPLIGPNYKLVIRDDTMPTIDKKIENHTRVPLPNCLFNGTLFDNDQVQVAISSCGSSQKKVVLVSSQWGQKSLQNRHVCFNV